MANIVSLNSKSSKVKSASIAVDGYRQPLWRYLLTTSGKTGRLKSVQKLCLLGNLGISGMVNGFILGDICAVGLIQTTLLRLRARLENPICLFQPITWLANGPAICVKPGFEASSVLELEGQTLSCPPLGSDIMAFWHALFPTNYGSPLETFFKLKPTHTPEILFEDPTIVGAILIPDTLLMPNFANLHVVTNLRVEWEKATQSKTIPVMGGLIGIQDWVDKSPALIDEIRDRLIEGLRLYKRDRIAFINQIREIEGYSRKTSMDERAIRYWCSYWGMDEIDEDRLWMREQDEKDQKMLEAMMKAADCLS